MSYDKKMLKLTASEGNYFQPANERQIVIY
jgi:hypothetical protein